MNQRLRLYCGPDTEIEVSTVQSSQQKITVSAGEVFSWLADAVRNNRSWLRDFEDDQVTISSDLYEVILAYQHFRRPSA
jgi:hypothetical protein